MYHANAVNLCTLSKRLLMDSSWKMRPLVDHIDTVVVRRFKIPAPVKVTFIIFYFFRHINHIFKIQNVTQSHLQNIERVST